MGKFSKSNKASEPLLDLHGAREDEVFDLVDQFLRSPKVTRSKKARILPGKGKGIVKKKLIEYLKLGGYPWEFERDSKGNKNEGSLIVFVG